MKKESRKRLPTKLLALLLTALLFIGALPVNAMAQEAGDGVLMDEPVNTVPTLAEGVDAEVSAAVGRGDSYMLDLSSLFTDADGDPLAYEVRVGAAAYAAAEANYTYAPSEAGETVLTFRANDGTAYSTATYAVTLTVREPEEETTPDTGDITTESTKQSATAQSLGDIPSGETSIGQVYVRIEDSVPKSDDPDDPGPRGIMAEGWVDLYPSDDMMSVIVRLAGSSSLAVEGAESGYITSIGGLAEFDRGLMSGWMGTLNDWFVNEGFSSFSVANGTLAAGDTVAVVYTLDYGEDSGGTWANSDKTLKSLAVNTGVLSPAFDKDTHTYTLTVPAGTTSVVLTPTAANKYYQVRTSVGDVTYQRTQGIPVSEGTEITVKCGDPAWPSMNADDTPAEVYSITVEMEAEAGDEVDLSENVIEDPQLSAGIFWTPMFGEFRNVRFAYAHLPLGTEKADFTFRVPEGVEVYDSDGEKLEQAKDGSYTLGITVTSEADNDLYLPQWATGTGGQAVVFQLKSGEQTADYRLNVLRRDLTSGVSVVDYLCIGSQYTNKSSYGLYPERMLAGGSDWNTPVSIGGFGGYITFQLDEPVVNDPNNPYGVDFMIYGNSYGGQGLSEPGNVLVSEDGVNWYALAGSDYFDDNTEWGYTLTYSEGADNKIYWEDRYGNTGTMRLGEHPPTNENYPLASFDPAQPITVTGALLKSSATDDYGTSAAAYPDWGYVDVVSNQQRGNPYTGDDNRGGGFDLSWAVDADGNPVELNSVNYVKVMTASHIDGGAIGEKSTEVNAFLRATPSDTAVGKTTAPSEITVNGNALALKDGVNEYSVIAGDGEVAVEVTAPADANIYINNEYGASRTYETAPEKGVIRVLVQEGEKEPYLCYITLITEEEAADVLADITQAVESVSISERTGLYVSETEYDENWDEIPITNIEQTWQLEMGREDIAVSVVESENAAIASDGTITFGEARVQGNVKFRFTKDGISYEKMVLVTVPVHIKTVQEQIDALAALFASDAGFDLIKGENAEKSQVKQPLNLQTSATGYSLSGYSDVALEWESSDTDVIDPPSYGSRSVKVNRPAKGEEDAEVTLRLTITKGRYASGSATAKTVNFVLTVPAITDAEYEEAKAAVDAALSGVTLEGFTESGSLGETAIDPDALDFDVQLKSVANLISAGMIEDNAVNRSMEYGWSTSGTEADGNYLKINSLRCNVIRTVGAGDTETDLILTLTYNGYSGSKSFPVTIRGLTQQEVDDANAEMEEYEAALWDGLKGENTDSAFVASDLGWDRDNGHVVFYRMHKEDGKIVYTLKNSSCPENIGVELGSWKSSDPSVIGQSTGGYGTADLLAVTRPAFGEDDRTVTLSANMTSLRYRNAKNADGTAAVPDMTAELTVTVPAYTNVLASLSVAGADVPFDPAQNAFSVTVPADTKEVKVTAVAKDPAAAVTIGGQPADEAGCATVALSGESAQIPVVTTVQGHARTVTLTVNYPADIQSVYEQTGAYLYQTVQNPVVASTGGEWAVIGLARAGYPVDGGYYDRYVANVINTLKENDGVLDSRKYTEYSRVVLALTAVGYDVTNVGGYHLLAPLADYDRVVWQGVNGPIWALIAFDSHGYSIPAAPDGATQTTRENLVEAILDLELPGGGWALTGGSADADITAMAIQALAPYYETDAEARAAVDRALEMLSGMQDSQGGFASKGIANSESCAQVVVALTSLGLDPDTDPRFVKNGNSVLDALLSFAVTGGGFIHDDKSGGINGMSTEQAYYALAAYTRYINGRPALYDMRDVEIDAPYQSVIRIIDAIGTVTLSSGEAISAARSAYNALTTAERQMVTNYGTLTAAEKKLAELQAPINAVKEKIDAIGTVTLSSKEAIEAARRAYNGLSATEKRYVTNYAVLTRAEAKFGQLENANAVEALIDAIGTVTLSSGEAISAARSAYDALTAEEKALVGNYAKLTAAERAFQRLSTSSGTTPEREPEKTPEGVTKTVESGKKEVTVDGLRYVVSEEAAAVIEKIQALPQSGDYDLEAVIEAYRQYAALTDSQKAEVVNDADLEAMTNRVGADNHMDTATGLKVDGLAWYIRLSVREVTQTEEAYTRLSESVGSNTLVQMLEITLTDILTGETYQPSGEITFLLPSPDMSGFDSVAVAQYTDDGQVAYLSCEIKDGEIEWKATSLPYYGILGGAAEATALLTGEDTGEAGAAEAGNDAVAEGAPATPQEAGGSLLWLWILLLCIGAAVILIILVKKRTVSRRAA